MDQAGSILEFVSGVTEPTTDGAKGVSGSATF